MTFEEFFKKKKISLLLLQSSEAALFAEFENHYNQMGAKSFDHTKKYWFNQLRRRFPLPPEVKVEKLHIENQLAEQTITDSLTEPTAPSVGFKPRFKADGASKPVEEKAVTKPETSEEKPAETTIPPPAVGFKPRFKASMVQKPTEEKAEPTDEKPVTETPVEAIAPPPAPAVGFKPRFKASMVQKPAEEKLEEPIAAVTSAPIEPEVKTEEPASEPPTEDAPKPVGFKPRFNMNKMKPKE